MSAYDDLIMKKLCGLNYAVYEYIEINTDIVRYIGIVNKGSMANRHRQHMKDDWYESEKYKIRYIQCETQSETEAIESHLISMYPEDQLFNKAKIGWGLNKYLPADFNWIDLDITIEDIIEDMYAFWRYSDLKEYYRDRLYAWIKLLEQI